MTRVGWLADESSQIGGAELTQAEFRDAAPQGVEIVDCLPGDCDCDCDAYVVQNCVKYALEDFETMRPAAPVTKYWHDVGPWLLPGVREWLDERTTPICCSPIQAEYMGLDAALVPPPVDLARFAEAAKGMNGNRAGAVSIGSWRNYGKAPHKAAEWADGDIDFFGDGVLAPPGATPVRYDDMPTLMAKYKTFVFLPTVIEPFGRLVAEAWASGLEVVTNRLVGSLHWIENDPGAIETSADDFWQIALRDCK